MPKDKSSGKKLADMLYGNPERAAFGVFPQMKPKRSKQDPEAAKNFPVDLARGILAGAVGIPGDIESLARLPYELYTGNESPTFLPTSEDVLKRIPFGTNTPAGQFASGIGTIAGGSANIGPIIRAVKATPGALKAAARNLSTPRTLNPEAGAIIIPSKISKIKEAARQSKGEYGAKRIERAADEVKNLEKLYNEQALREAFLGDNAKAVVTMSPDEFERYAQELKGRTSADIGPKMAELARQGEIDKYTVPTDEYIQHLMRVQGGFDQAPYLNLFKDEVGIPSMPEIKGHEGRHRSRALSEAGEPSTIVQISPRGDLREGLPRGSQEEYIEALREELERSGRLVLPERDGSYRRPAVEFPEVYAEGGSVHISDNPDVMQLELAAGGLVRKGIKAIKSAAESAGQKAPVLAEKELTTLQDVHTNLGDRVRAGAMEAQKMMEGFDYKYDKGQRVFTKDSSGKNKPPYTILSRTRVGNQVMREDHPEFGQGMGRPIIDPETGKAMRTPYEPGYRVRMERNPDDWSEFEIPEKAIVGDVEMAAGGAVHMQAGGLAKAAKAAAKALKPAEAPMKASEALGRIEGRPLVITQADRTKVGGGYLGGPGFSGLQLTEPEYRAAEAAWGVKTPGVAKMILGGGKAAGKDPVYAAMLGTPTQHQSNQMVFDKLYGDFKKSAKKGSLDPELRDRINMRLANTVDKEGNPIFPSDVDILGKNFKELANTFDRRAVTANLIGGMGVGGKKGQIIDYDKIIRETTDPLLIDAPTGALGNRLFTLSGGIIERPDLHPAFPTILQGEDLGVSFDPVARELIMKDFMERTMREKGRTPGYMDYTRGYPPSQLITEDLLTELQKMGKKAGGEVKAPAAQIDGNKFVLAAQKYGLSDDMATLNKMVSLVNQGATVEEAARVLSGGVRKAAGGEITADDLILEERKL